MGYPLGEKIMNNKKQAGGVSKLMLMLIIGGIGYGAYYAKNKGLVSIDSVKTMASSMNSAFTNAINSNGSFSGYGIQLMATHQLDQAKTLMNDFARDGYSAFVLSSKAHGRAIYKVRLGPYSHKPEAVAIKDKVIRRYPNNPYVKTSLVIFKPN